MFPGCGPADQPPAACLSGPQELLSALKTAPDAVTLDGTPISACLADTADPSASQAVGGDLVDAASTLATRVAEAHDSASATQLGYLVGAVRRGAGDPPGVHAELLRRLELELERVDVRSPSFRQGEKAGEATG
jgi:hypothetical protein